MSALKVSEETWEQEVLRAPEPVLVDFWAPWCAPCRALGPRIDALAEAYGGRARVAKLNVDEAPGVTGEYQVRAIPTLLLFRGGQLVERRVGALSDADLRVLVDAQLGAAASPRP